MSGPVAMAVVTMVLPLEAIAVNALAPWLRRTLQEKTMHRGHIQKCTGALDRDLLLTEWPHTELLELYIY